MPSANTKAKDMFGDELYQRRARVALPLLVRQAQVGQKITYSDLAEELDMPKPRNLDYVLGSIGRTFDGLAEQWQKAIPSIRSIVVNKNTGLPGEGLGDEYAELDPRQKEALIKRRLSDVFAYSRWPEVLQALGLTEAPKITLEPIQSTFSTTGHGESEEHRRLKEYIARNPKSVDLPKVSADGEMEYRLPSGDSVDVVFKSRKRHTAVEVKSSRSDQNDLARGLFQCVKYRVILEAWRNVKGESHECRALLAIEGKFPKELISKRNVLGVQVIDNIRIEN